MPDTLPPAHRAREELVANLMAVPAVIGLVLAVLAFFQRGSGITGTAGAGLAILGMVALSIAALLVGRLSPGRFRTFVAVMILIGGAADADLRVVPDAGLADAGHRADAGPVADLHPGREVKAMIRILPALILLAPAAHAQQTEWTGFHGNGMAQKYSASTQITPENVGDLEMAWEIHTGDVSDGSGDISGTVWSATPILANDLLYVGTPFYRILGRSSRHRRDRLDV